MKKLTISLFIFLFFQNYCYAETLMLKTGEAIKGSLIKQTDQYIQVGIDAGSNIVPYTFYLDEIKSIDGEIINIELSSPIIQQQNNKPFKDEYYDFQVIFPDRWHVVVGQDRIKQRIDDIKNWQDYQASNLEELDPDIMQFAKGIANVVAEEISFVMTPYFAAYEKKPVNFYKERRPIPEITMEIQNISIDDPLGKAKEEIIFMLPFLEGEFIEGPEIIEKNGSKALQYSIQYNDDEDRVVSKSIFKTIHNGMEITFEMLTKAMNFSEYKELFNNVVNSFQ